MGKEKDCNKKDINKTELEVNLEIGDGLIKNKY